MESIWYRISGAAQFVAKAEGGPMTVHTIRKHCRLGTGPDREFDPTRGCWLYSEAALLAWVLKRRAQRSKAPIAQPAWLGTPEARARAQQARAERRAVLRGDRVTSAA